MEPPAVSFLKDRLPDHVRRRADIDRRVEIYNFLLGYCPTHRMKKPHKYSQENRSAGNPDPPGMSAED